MERQKTLKLALATSAAFALQGCIAAAFPIAAGGLMAGGGRTGGSEDMAAAPPASDTQTSSVASTQSEPIPAEPVRAENSASLASAAVAEETSTPAGNAAERSAPLEVAANSSDDVAEVEAAMPPPSQPSASLISVESEPDPEPDSVPAAAPVRIASTTGESSIGEAAEAPVQVTDAGPALSSAEATFVVDDRTPEPPPAAAPVEPAQEIAASAAEPVVEEPAQIAGVAAAPSNSESGGLVPIQAAPAAVAGGTFFDPFFSYASSREFAGRQERKTAMLVDAPGLRADRLSCTSGQSTVLIDLDPENGDLLPIDARSASPALATRLADLRRIGIAIAWISENSADKENEIRAGLARSGLDPLGSDRVLLMRSADERKQLRREQLAQTDCVIAIAGDARSDFHELYDYLLNPADARSLEPVIGEGWFLIPTPLISERPQ